MCHPNSQCCTTLGSTQWRGCHLQSVCATQLPLWGVAREIAVGASNLEIALHTETTEASNCGRTDICAGGDDCDNGIHIETDTKWSWPDLLRCSLLWGKCGFLLPLFKCGLVGGHSLQQCGFVSAFSSNRRALPRFYTFVNLLICSAAILFWLFLVVSECDWRRDRAVLNLLIRGQREH